MEDNLSDGTSKINVRRIERKNYKALHFEGGMHRPLRLLRKGK